jgi:hypothetical protein
MEKFRNVLYKSFKNLFRILKLLIFLILIIHYHAILISVLKNSIRK